ncbi:MAG: DUF4198 domain-containing protein [Candidatus Aminicenantia bacterium]
MKKLLFFILFLYLPCFPHDFWINREGESFYLFYGHYPDQIVSMDFLGMRLIKCLNEKLEENEVKLEKKNGKLEIKGKCDMILIKYDHGFWSKTPDGNVPKPKNQVENAVESWKTTTFIKYINKWSENFTKPTGIEFEFLPLRNPFNDYGKKGRFKIILNGEPASSATLEIGHRVIGNVYKDGTANVRLSKEGIQIIKAFQRFEIKDPSADYEIFETVLILEAEK